MSVDAWNEIHKIPCISPDNTNIFSHSVSFLEVEEELYRISQIFTAPEKNEPEKDRGKLTVAILHTDRLTTQICHKQHPCMLAFLVSTNPQKHFLHQHKTRQNLYILWVQVAHHPIHHGVPEKILLQAE